MQVTICDRCGKPVGTKIHARPVWHKETMQRYEATVCVTVQISVRGLIKRLDLCDSCEADIINFRGAYLLEEKAVEEPPKS